MIAIIDDGVDIDHEEFASDGKIVAPRRSRARSGDDPRPTEGANHGTGCAGVACARRPCTAPAASRPTRS